MSRGYSRVVFVGNLTRDPELKHLPSGTPVLDLSLAANESYRSKDGQTVDRVCFVNAVVMGRQAEATAQYMKKGRAVLVDGRLQMDEWTAEGGQKRTRLKIRADQVQFLGSGNGRRPNGDAQPNAAQPAGAGVEAYTPF
ncbi:MAG: single-stranded DNA-binding protein [Kiritimatiellae bacterium]|nr:single-stranded DNA-binding protein [Kiritimatiellia bacterium]